jgi:hypothetical protein
VNSVNESRQEVQAVRRIDFVLRDEGTIWLFTPLTPAALQFLSEHIQDEAQYFGDYWPSSTGMLKASYMVLPNTV